MIYFRIEKEGKTFDVTEKDLQELGFNPKTMRRFTGLKDKKGTPLFEGDEIDLYSPMGYSHDGKIYWSNRHASFVVADENKNLISSDSLGKLSQRYYITKK